MRKRGAKTELDVTNEHVTACLQHAGCARKAYHWGLARKQEARVKGEPMPDARALHRELTALKASAFPSRYECSKCAPQEALIDLDHAFRHFFRKVPLKKQGKWRGKCGSPTFKSRKKGIGGFRLTGAIHVFDKSIQLPRLGSLRLKEKLSLPKNAKIGSATISEQAGRCYVSIGVQEEVAEPEPASGPVIGVDLGVKTLATVAEGREIANPQALRKRLKNLQRLSRWHSRKHKGSAKRKKSQRRLARMPARIAHVRQDARCRVLVVSRWEPPSQTCSGCGWRHPHLRLADRVFLCQECGLPIGRDLNAAQNLAAFAEIVGVP